MHRYPGDLLSAAAEIERLHRQSAGSTYSLHGGSYQRRQGFAVSSYPERGCKLNTKTPADDREGEKCYPTHDASHGQGLGATVRRQGATVHTPVPARWVARGDGASLLLHRPAFRAPGTDVQGADYFH
jgi:hypothetical protein